MDGRILFMRDKPAARILYIEAYNLYVIVDEYRGKPCIRYYPAAHVYQTKDGITTYGDFIEENSEHVSTVALPEPFGCDLVRCFTLMSKLIKTQLLWREYQLPELLRDGVPEPYLTCPQPTKELQALLAKEPEFIDQLNTLLTSPGSLQ